MKHILVLGAGFAGLAAAAGAMRKLVQSGAENSVSVTVVDQNSFHSIRVRNYEEALEDSLVPLASVLDPIGVGHLQGRVVAINTQSRCVDIETDQGRTRQPYDELVCALGSRLNKPDSVPGLLQHAFDIDTYASAMALRTHLHGLAAQPVFAGQFTVVVVGGGFTGIELAAELPARLRPLQSACPGAEPLRVVLLEAGPRLGGAMTHDAHEVVMQALGSLGVEVQVGARVAAVCEQGVSLSDGSFIAAATTVWCGGMSAHPLMRQSGFECDVLGRARVDTHQRVEGVPHVFATGDCAVFEICPGHDNVMSCQHGRPMGRFAGHNAAAAVLGQPLLPLQIERYVTVMDLGEWGALYTEGRDRRLVASGPQVKQTKQTINRQRIYPPRTGRRNDILDDAAPVLQAAPKTA